MTEYANVLMVPIKRATSLQSAAWKYFTLQSAAWKYFRSTHPSASGYCRPTGSRTAFGPGRGFHANVRTPRHERPARRMDWRSLERYALRVPSENRDSASPPGGPVAVCCPTRAGAGGLQPAERAKTPIKPRFPSPPCTDNNCLPYKKMAPLSSVFAPPKRPGIRRFSVHFCTDHPVIFNSTIGTAPPNRQAACFSASATVVCAMPSCSAIARIDMPDFRSASISSLRKILRGRPAARSFPLLLCLSFPMRPAA